MKVKGLQKEIVLWTAVPIIAIFVIAVLILRMNLTNQVSQVIDEELRLQAAQVTTATEEFFDEHVAYCQAMGSTEAVKNMIYEGLERDVNYIDTSYYWPARNSMAALAEKFPAIMQAYVGGTLRNDMMTHDGVSILDLPEGFDILSRDWAIASVNGEICYMPPYVDAVTGNMVTTVSAPIMDDGRVIGSFGLDLLLTDVQDIFATTEVGQTGFVVVFLPDGTVFYHPNEEYNTLPYTEIGLSDEALEVMDNNITNTVVKFKMDGEKYVGTLNNIGETGWSMLTCMTQKEAYSVSNSGVLMMVIILLVALLLIISIISYVGHLIVRPIVRLVYSAKKLAVGDVEIECEHRDVEHDEVDELINAFAEVVENNKRQADELESLANGNTELVVDVRSSSDVLNIAMKKVVDTLNDLIAETADLTQNMILGNTTHRGNAARFEGGYKNIIEGFNQTIDAIMAEIDIFAGALSELGQGEMPEITASVEGDYVKIVDSLKASVANIRGMVDDTQTMMAATANGNFGERVDARRYKGEFLKIIEGINKTLDTVVDKTAWYEAIINSIPLPVQVMDSSENWALVNTAFYETMRKADSSIVHITDIYGRKCFMEGLEINGVPALKEGNPDTRLDFQGKNYMQTTAPLKDKFGKSIGYVGTWQDLTSVLKSSEFAANEIGRLQGNLHNLALGNFEFAKSNQSVDEYTKDLADQFMVIDASMNEVADAVGKLIEDTKEMVEAAVDGDLGKRLDASVHSGEYAAVVQGINNILDEVLAPIGETLTVLQEVAAGNLQKMVEGDYRGEHAQTKDALNNTILNLRRVIDEIAEVLAAIGGGDLTVSINADNYAGDFVAIKDAMLNITARLRGVMKGLNESSEQVANGSRQLSEAAQTLANGSTQQASAIEQLTATVTEIAGQTKHNADDAREASSLANGVKSSAERGDRQMKEMLVSMDEINESSANISKIIKTIDDIAFQTNILALNAAVEAARAGVHGKGFAVVADEVRSLAAKSAQAAAETTALIEGSIDKVEAGTKIANETAEALGEIVEGIGKTADIVDRIAAASGEQAVGINEVNKGIEQVSEVVQSNSATAEESAASSQELYNQADMLKKMVSSFRIKGKGHRNRGSNVPAMRIEPEVEPSFTESSTPEINISLDFDVNDKY